MKLFRNKAFSFFAIAALAISLPVTSYILVNNDFELRISAFESDEPVHVVVTDVKSGSFRITWMTQKEVIGGVRLVDNPTSPTFEETPSRYHSVNIVNLTPGITHKFVLLSNDAEWKENDAPYEVATPDSQTPDERFLIYGQVFSKDGFSFQQGGTIVIDLENSEGKSQPVSSTLNEAGGYQLDLGGLLTSDLREQFNYRSQASLHATVYTAVNEEPVVKEYTVTLSTTRQVPNIFLGDASLDVIPGLEGT